MDENVKFSIMETSVPVSCNTNPNPIRIRPFQSHIPDLYLQTPAVEFIENHSNAHHPAFGTPPSQYDPDRDLFVVCDPQPLRFGVPLESHMMHSLHATTAPPLPIVDHDERLPPRPLAKPSDALEFWDSVFEPAMAQFTKAHMIEPPEISQMKRGIRSKRDWTSVFDQLEAAKQKYSDVDKGFKARFRKVYRKVAENVAPLGIVLDIVPSNEYVSPVLGVIQVLLEV